MEWRNHSSNHWKNMGFSLVEKENVVLETLKGEVTVNEGVLGEKSSPCQKRSLCDAFKALIYASHYQLQWEPGVLVLREFCLHLPLPA